MAGVTIEINGKKYPVACEAGQEIRIARLGCEVDARVRSLSAAGARAGEAQLLVMAALLLADERDDARAEAGSAAAARAAAETAGAEAGAEARARTEAGAKAAENLAGSLESLARRIEAVAERIEAA